MLSYIIKLYRYLMGVGNHYTNDTDYPKCYVCGKRPVDNYIAGHLGRCSLEGLVICEKCFCKSNADGGMRKNFN